MGHREGGPSLHRVLLPALLVASVPGFFSGFERNAYVVVGMLLLVWVPQVRVPVAVGRLCGLLASASLWIYLVHWQIYPLLEYRIPLLATLFSLAAGVLAWRAWEAAGARLAAGPRTGTESPSPGGPVDRARIDTAGGGPGLVRTRESGR